MLHSSPMSSVILRRLSGRSRIGLAPSQNLVRSHKRLGVDGLNLSAEPAGSHRGAAPASVFGHFVLEGAVLRFPFELTADEAVRIGAALIFAGRQALGAALPATVEQPDAEAVIELGQALDAMRGPR